MGFAHLMMMGGAPGGGSGCGCGFTKTQLAFALFAFTVVPELPTLLHSRQATYQLCAERPCSRRTAGGANT